MTIAATSIRAIASLAPNCGREQRQRDGRQAEPTITVHPAGEEDGGAGDKENLGCSPAPTRELRRRLDATCPFGAFLLMQDLAEE